MKTRYTLQGVPGKILFWNFRFRAILSILFHCFRKVLFLGRPIQMGYIIDSTHRNVRLSLNSRSSSGTSSRLLFYIIHTMNCTNRGFWIQFEPKIGFQAFLARLHGKNLGTRHSLQQSQSESVGSKQGSWRMFGHHASILVHQRKWAPRMGRGWLIIWRSWGSQKKKS